MPHTPGEPTPLTPPMPEMGAAKRRAAANHPYPPLPPKANPLLPPPLAAAPARRRRLLVYLAAFAVMLTLSSMLDLRRAALNARRRDDRVTLALPAALDDDTAHPGAAPPLPPPPADGAALAAAAAKRVHAHAPAPAAHPSSAADAPPAAPQTEPDRKLSAQELKDDVAQFIAHVDQEAAANTTSTAADAAHAAPAPDQSAHHSSATPVGSAHSASDAGKTASDAAPPLLAAGGASQAAPAGANATADVGGADAEELFTAAQARVEAMAGNDTLKPLLGADELRTLHALALQGSRGDCVQATDPRGGGSLFKTDAEAAGTDVEKTDPLWGAWCIFSGRYRSDAMREYVVRAKGLQTRLDARLAAHNSDAKPAIFDQHVALLDDVLTPEEQTALRSKADLVLPHLEENDARFLAALSLQATLGDCAPYASASVPSAAKSDDTANAAPAAAQPRVLTEPIFGHTAVRGEGALWGAWCVLQRRKRSDAAARLSDRVELFLHQLSQKLAPDAAAVAPAAAVSAVTSPKPVST